MKQKLMFSLCFAALLISLPVNKVNALEPDTSPFIDFYGELRYIGKRQINLYIKNAVSKNIF